MIATPDGYQIRRIIERVRMLNPKIDTAVRTHNESEVAHPERHARALRSWANRHSPSE
jgi:monovalent cation:H+ antiporter-2, CPA2 family